MRRIISSVVLLCIAAVSQAAAEIKCPELKIESTTFKYKFGEKHASGTICLTNIGGDVLFLEKIVPSCGGCTKIDKYDQILYPNTAGKIVLSVNTDAGVSPVFRELILSVREKSYEFINPINVAFSPSPNITILPSFVYWNKQEPCDFKTMAISFESEDMRIEGIEPSDQQFVWEYVQAPKQICIKVKPVSTEVLTEGAAHVKLLVGGTLSIGVNIRAFVK